MGKQKGAFSKPRMVEAGARTTSSSGTCSSMIGNPTCKYPSVDMCNNNILGVSLRP